VSNFNDLKKFLLNVLESHCKNTYYGQAAAGAFPRLEYEIKEMSALNEPYSRYVLTLNLYDKNTSQTVDDIADAIIENVGTAQYYNENYHYKFYYNQDRQALPDTDKTIQHIRLTFEVRTFTRSDT
jgi:hypothetical protein